ncbi:hypothetical protein B4102_2705 [Heyndrickxia sporothermodurans]|uniref:CobW C-terminal domain-containing protein n=1 Tax=Heyndrickxia sporothermodurans TaxID=46224 RepID=A0A150LA60_9BACI|nr:GTP-binding protein [Heyndrickxia sporothermodurans]KYD08899.1 hypothetical protein B4102_2705 [Heyndrickxia sporothermodurans]
MCLVLWVHYKDLYHTLRSLSVQHIDENIDILLIEGTGVAHPREVTGVFARSDIAEIFLLKSTIGIVDASHFLDYLSIFASSKEIRTLLKEQVQQSTIVLLNKADRINEKEKVKIQKKIETILETNVPVYFTTYSDIEMTKIRKQTQIPDNNKINTHHHPQHHGDIVTLKVENVPVVEKRTFTKWLSSLPKDVIRVKGLVQLKNEDYLTHVQYADNVVRYTKLGKEDKRSTVLIFIGRELKSGMLDSFSNELL